MEIHTCKLTGDTFIEFKGVIGKSRVSRDGKQIFEPVRKFFYSGDKVGLSISVDAVTTIGSRKRIRSVDVVCFNEDAFKGILALKLKEKDKISVCARQTEKGLVVEDPNDVSKVKAI